MHLKTLKQRLIVTSLGWIAASLSVMGMFLITLFYLHLEARLDTELENNLKELAAATETAADGAPSLTWRPSDPRFNRPLSGWYWQVLDRGAPVAGSASILDGTLMKTTPTTRGRPEARNLLGPEEVRLRAVVQAIAFPDRDAPLTYVVAAPKRSIELDVAQFAGMVVAGMVVLGLALLGVLVVQVGYGLKPLRLIQERLVAVRAGKEVHLADTDLPEEVRPVIGELNDMLTYNAALLERARSQVGDLAHTLKTPLTILRGEARALKGEQGEMMRKHLAAIGENIDNYLTRARVSGARVLGARTEVAAIVDDLLESMRLLHGERGLDWRAEGLDGLVFHGDEQDFEEMLGSLLDNAGKWAASSVLVRGAIIDDTVAVSVEDDGPGVPEDRRAEVLRRGKRIDETVPGTGLGLAITADIAEFYGGRLDLGQAAAGGLAATLILPATA